MKLLVSNISGGSSASKSATMPNESRPRKLCFLVSMADEIAAALVTKHITLVLTNFDFLIHLKSDMKKFDGFNAHKSLIIVAL